MVGVALNYLLGKVISLWMTPIIACILKKPVILFVILLHLDVEFIVDLELLRILETDLPSYVLPNNDKVLQDLFDYMEVDEGKDINLYSFRMC